MFLTASSKTTEDTPVDTTTNEPKVITTTIDPNTGEPNDNDEEFQENIETHTYGTMNGSDGTFELVVDMKNKVIVHYLFRGIK